MNFNKWVRFSFSQSKIKERDMLQDTKVIGSGYEYWESVEMEGEKKHGLFACLNNLVTHPGIGDQAFGP